jgi:2-octaprenyl-6-methoxyphenol hydroxylase
MSLWVEEQARNMNSKAFDIVVVGAGPTGKLAAIMAASNGYETLLLGPDVGSEDGRTTAVLEQGLNAMRPFGVLDQLEPVSGELKAIRILDDTKRLLRAPNVTFHAKETGMERFGLNISNADLNAALSKALKEQNVEWCEDYLESLECETSSCMLHTQDGHAFKTGIVIAADGKKSPCRKAAGIKAVKWSYPQSALVTVVDHDLDHDGISTEFHTRTGPFTLVPMVGKRSSIVCVVEPFEAEDMLEMDRSGLDLELEKRAHSLLGVMQVATKPQAWPLSAHAARHFAAKRVYLVGEASHSFPPIGAQGFNLSTRDISDVFEVLNKARDLGSDLGSEATMQSYNANRRKDVYSRTAGVDMLNRSLLSNMSFAQLARFAGSGLAANSSLARRALMKVGMGV